jgi:hypothetical protein
MIRSKACCFPAGTLIRMADGSERAIERVRPNEVVVTAEGRTGLVKQSLMRREARALVELTIWGHAPLYVTPEHPMLTKRGYVRVGDLRLGDQIGLIRYRPEARAELVTTDLISPRERNARAALESASVFGAAAVIVTAPQRSAPIPDLIPLSPRFGRLVGVFLAAGTTTTNPLHFSFGSEDRASLASDCLDMVLDLGAAAGIGARSSNKIIVNVEGREWISLWDRLCGARMVDRMVHPLLMGDDNFLRAVLDGWLACDGYAARATRHRGSTISKVLAYGMYDIAQALGLRPTISLRPPSYDRQKWSYEVQVEATRSHDGDGAVQSCEMDETYVWRRIRGTQERAFDEMVYNLSVEGDESYVAEGVAVHNCTAGAK